MKIRHAEPIEWHYIPQKLKNREIKNRNGKNCQNSTKLQYLKIDRLKISPKSHTLKNNNTPKNKDINTARKINDTLKIDRITKTPIP